MPSKITPESAPLLAPSPSPIKALSDFTRLSPVVGLYTPPSTSPPPPANHPTTILLCAWMNATPKHIAYYTRNYQTLFPSARIILITITTKQFMFESETKRRADITPAITALLANDQSQERLLVHCLSNGGAKRTYGVAGAYQNLTGHVLPIKCNIIDSAPGIPQFRRDIHALTVPARKLPLLARLAFISITVVVASVVFVVVNWLPKSVWHELVWGPTAGFNNKGLFDGGCLKAYIYSKEDAAIDWRDVERHADVAQEKGYRVERKLVRGAEHAQMFRGEGGEAEYWGWVRSTWTMAVGGK